MLFTSPFCTRVRYTLGVVVAASLATVMGCSSLKVTSEHDDTVDFSSYQTFQWTNPPEDVQAGGAGAGWVMRSLRRSVVEDLKSRGYQEVDADPDFLVTGYVQFDQPTAGLGAGSRAGMAGQGGAAAYALREGDLHVLILDPSSKEVWSGHASGALGSGDGEPQENLEAVVGRVMERFPPE